MMFRSIKITILSTGSLLLTIQIYSSDSIVSLYLLNYYFFSSQLTILNTAPNVSRPVPIYPSPKVPIPHISIQSMGLSPIEKTVQAALRVWNPLV